MTFFFDYNRGCEVPTLTRVTWEEMGGGVEERKMDGDFVTDSLKGEVAMWRWFNIPTVLVTAPTGAGKNFFVEKCLIDYVNMSGGRLLLLSNRVALNRQEKQRICEIYDQKELLKNYTDEGIDLLTKIGQTYVLSYQKLSELAKNTEAAETKAFLKINFSFVVCDETHFFMADSLFNAWTDVAFDFITNNFKCATKIYMSATPDEIFPYILSAERPYYGKWGEWKIPVYCMKGRFDKFQTIAFDKIDEIISAIQISGSQKWLIQVQSIDEGMKIHEKLKQLKIVSEFISSKSKSEGAAGHKCFQDIVKTQKFTCQVLISTTVIDNGVNIVDKNLKNIVMFTNDKTQFLQFLGRKRFTSPEDTVNLYIHKGDISSINRQMTQIVRKLKGLDTFEQNPSVFFSDYVLGARSAVGVHQAIRLNVDSKMAYNRFARLKLEKFDLQFYFKVKKRMEAGDSDALLREKLSWLGKDLEEAQSIQNLFGNTEKNELLEFLDRHRDELMPKEEQDKFREEITLLFNRKFGLRKNSKNQTAAYGLNKINKILIENASDYTIESSRRGWIVRKIEQT